MKKQELVIHVPGSFQYAKLYLRERRRPLPVYTHTGRSTIPPFSASWAARCAITVWVAPTLPGRREGRTATWSAIP